MHRIWVWIFFLAVWTACQTETPQTLLVKEARKTLANASTVLDSLSEWREPAGTESGIGTLQVRNMTSMIRSNQQTLHELVEETTRNASPEATIQVETQSAYLQSLIAAARALLDGRSLSIGTWEGEAPSEDSMSEGPVAHPEAK